jgi:uncharacterized protein
MLDDEKLSFAVSVIKEACSENGLAVVRTVLFGSRAKGTANHESDWDFLVSVDKEPSFRIKAKTASSIRTKLASFHISVDIIIKSEDRIVQERENPGLITHYALKEGCVI